MLFIDFYIVYIDFYIAFSVRLMQNQYINQIPEGLNFKQMHFGVLFQFSSMFNNPVKTEAVWHPKSPHFPFYKQSFLLISSVKPWLHVIWGKKYIRDIWMKKYCQSESE